MSTLLIEGGQRSAAASTSKATRTRRCRLLAACLLTEQECVLHNVPRIGDVEVMARLLLDLGAEVDGIGTNTLRIRCPEVVEGRAGSVAGRTTARIGAAARPAARATRTRAHRAARRRLPGAAHDRHAPGRAAARMGARELDAPGHALEAPDGLNGRLHLSRRSLGHGHRDGAPRRGLRRRAQRDPSRRDRAARRRAVPVPGGDGRRHRGRGHVDDLASTACSKRRGATHTLWGDYIDAGSWAVIGAITGGTVEVRGARAEDVEVAVAVLRRLGRAVHVRRRRGCSWSRRSSVRAGASRPASGPSFPSDLVSLVTVLATQAEGRTLVHDWMYELRLFALDQMSGMRADFFLCDPHRIIVSGPSRLRGRSLDSRDLRSGMSLDRGGAGRGRRESRQPARNRRAGLQPARRATAVARRAGSRS